MSSWTKARREALWLENRRWIAACLLAHLPRGVELDDLLQDVALRVMRKIDELKDQDALKPWLRRVAINTAMEAGRRVARNASDELGDVHDPRPASAARQSDSRSELAHVLRLVRRLAPEYSEPLLLKTLRGLSQREIAQVLETTEEAIESRLARARKKLREASRRSSQVAAAPHTGT